MHCFAPNVGWVAWSSGVFQCSPFFPEIMCNTFKHMCHQYILPTLLCDVVLDLHFCGKLQITSVSKAIKPHWWVCQHFTFFFALAPIVESLTQTDGCPPNRTKSCRKMLLIKRQTADREGEITKENRYNLDKSADDKFCPFNWPSQLILSSLTFGAETAQWQSIQGVWWWSECSESSFQYFYLSPPFK